MTTIRFFTAEHVVADKLTPVQRQVFEAVNNGSADDIRTLLRSNAGLDLDAMDSGGSTCLGKAVQLDHRDVVKILLQGGASVNKADFYGQTALQYVAETNNIDIARTLISAGANLDWNDVDNDGLSALHIAACKGRTAVAAAIIDAGADVRARDHTGVSVLHCAVANGHLDIVKRLLVAKADVNVTGSKTNRTPLFLALGTENKEMIDIILEHGAKVNIQDNYGMTVLCGACLQNSGEIGERLIKAGTRVNLADNKGNLPLHYAARNGNLQLAEALIEAGSEINVLNCHMDGPLHLAIRKAYVDVVRLLVDKGADPNLYDREDNRSPVHVAVEALAEPEVFETLIQILLLGGANLDTLSNDRTALWRAADEAKEDLAILLVQYGADPNIEGPHGLTVLHTACRRKLGVLVHTLLHAGLGWTQEQWLGVDAYSTGISPHLVRGYQHGVPMALHDKLGLFCTINTARYSTLSLRHLSRLALRTAARSATFSLINQLQLPSKLKDFVLLKIL